MKRVVVCLLLSVGCLSLAAGPSVKEVRKQIAANYAAISKAFIAKDFARFGDYMTDDFTAIPPGSTRSVGRDEIVKDFAGERAALTDIKWTKSIKKITLEGETAHVRADGRLEAKMTGRDGKPHAFLLTASSDDDWLKASGSWKLKQSKTTAFQAKLDGKPMNIH